MRRPLHLRHFHGAWVKVTLRSGEVIIDKFVDSGGSHGNVRLRSGRIIRPKEVVKFEVRVTGEEKAAARAVS